MEPVNKSVKGRWRGSKNRSLTHSVFPTDRTTFPAAGSPDKLLISDRQSLSAPHLACLYGQLTSVQLLVESRPEWINSSDLQGRRPLHMVLSSRSLPNTSLCLRYLLEQGADVNIKADSGETPLHLASSEGFLDCTEILVKAGANVMARDNMGHTPLDLARIWCRKKVARYLKSCMWREEKKKETQERKRLQALYCDLVDTARLNEVNKKALTDMKVAEWLNKKGLPPLRDSPRVLLSQYHMQCLPSDQNSSNHANPPLKHHSGGPQEDTKKPPASSSSPWSIFMGLQSEKLLDVPDLRDWVKVRRDSTSGQLQYTAKWDSTPYPAPDLPLDVLERVLFPKSFHSRIASPQHFEPKDIMNVQHRRYLQGRRTSPWTEVAMHLTEVLEPGHF